MGYNDILFRGATSASKPSAGGAVLRTTPVLGIVKNNIDATRSGRIDVYIADMCGLDPNKSSSWIPIRYMSTFYGHTIPTAPNTGYGEFARNPSSYGVWNSPPDIGSQVLCIFADGDPGKGFYIGCVPEPEALHMVPAIGGSENIIANQGEADSLGGATRLPVTNMNTNNTGLADSTEFLRAPKPVHSYSAAILSQQGLIRDPVRGVIGTSSQRETPSRVGWGVSTPGRPIYEGGYTDESITAAITEGKTPPENLKVISRRGGHTLVMDDGDILGKDQLVRLRSSLGHQITMSDDGQTLFIIHANGQSWVELGKEGTIDMYATNSVNVRTQGDLNLHADNNININAAKNLNISAGENIEVNSEKDMKFRVGSNFSHYIMEKYTVKVDGRMSMLSGGDASYASDAVTFVNGSKINLNTGSASLVPEKIDPLAQVAHTDTLFDATKGWAAAPGKLLSIVSRAPAHAPWANAGQGVDVKVNNNASAALPAAPSAAVAATNASATAAVPSVTQAIASTVPNLGAVSTALDQNTTNALVGQTALLASVGPAAAAVAQGSGIVNTTAGKVASLGKLAQSPTDLMNAGVLKPGSADLVNSLVNQGMPLSKAMPNALFTGKPGAENLTAFTQNTNAQVDVAVSGLQQAQTQLTNVGLITGKETGAQLSGLVMTTAFNGVGSAVDLVKNATPSALGSVEGIAGATSSASNKLIGDASSTLAAGKIAGDFAQNVTGGLGSITGAVGAVKVPGMPSIPGLPSLAGLATQAKGVAAGAFAAITSGFPKLKAGVPQNVREITEKAQADSASGGLPSLDSVGSALKTVSGALNVLPGSPVTNLTAAVATATAGVALATNLLQKSSGPGLASGLNALPGGTGAVSTLVNNAKGAVNNIPGTGSVTSLLQNSGTGLSLPTTLPNLPGTNLLSTASGIAGSLTKSLSDLKSGKLSLTSLASAGLPAGAAATLNSAISSLSSGQIKLPVVATNTNDRGEQNSLVSSLLGNPKIPAPNLGGISNESYTAGSEAINNKLNEQYELNKKTAAKVEEVRAARLAFNKAKNELPTGDPQINELRNKWLALSDELAALNTVA